MILGDEQLVEPPRRQLLLAAGFYPAASYTSPNF